MCATPTDIRNALTKLKEAQNNSIKCDWAIRAVKMLLEGKPHDEVTAHFAQREKEAKVFDLLLSEGKGVVTYIEWLKTQPEIDRQF